MARRRSPRCYKHERITVRFIDAATGESFSFTVYNARFRTVTLRDIAAHGHECLTARYRHTTDLDDRRHKRRP